MVSAPEGRLDSWKEIAAYLNRSVRTVRRWEHDEGLPVHRHMHQALGSVFAHRSELDAWRTPLSRASRPPAEAVSQSHGEARSIAVLPFANLSADPENEYFADGLTDELAVSLSRVRALRVISSTSSKVFRGTSKDVKTIATELRVRYLLEGSVRRAGNRLRVTARLIDTTSDGSLWADAYDGTTDDVFAIQERLARIIVEALELRLSADEERSLAERRIDSVPAYECYLRARHEGWRWRKDAIDHAVRLLHNGLAIIGENELLYAALGMAHLQYREAGIDVGERPLLDAEACAERISGLGNASASGLQLRGWIHYSGGRIQKAVRDLKLALELEPCNADTLLLLSNCYLISGRVPSARPLIARLLDVDPLTPLSRCMPAWADILDGNFANAAEPYRQMFEMDPLNPMTRLFYVWALILTGAGDSIEPLLDGFPAEARDTVPARLSFFLAHGRAGDQRSARAILTPDIEALATATDFFPRCLAHGFAMAGMPDQSLRWLQIAIDRGFIHYPFLRDHDPFFESLRGDPRFEGILSGVRVAWERFEA